MSLADLERQVEWLHVCVDDLLQQQRDERYTTVAEMFPHENKQTIQCMGTMIARRGADLGLAPPLWTRNATGTYVRVYTYKDVMRIIRSFFDQFGG